MHVGWLFCGAVMVAVPAQERVSAVAPILAFGIGCAPDAVPRTVRSREQLVGLLERLGWQGEVPDIDCKKRIVQFLPLGEGRGGNIRVSQVARAEGFVVRIEGEPGAVVVADRWAVVRYDRRAIVAPGGQHMRSLLFESDCPPHDGNPAFRIVEPASTSAMRGCILIRPTIVSWVPESEAPRCLVDAVAFAEFARQHEATSAAWGSLESLLRYVDFGRQVVLVRPIDRPGPVPAMGDAIGFYYTNGGVMVRGRLPQQPEPYLGVHILPRANGVLDYEVPVGGRDDQFHRAAQFRIEHPATAPKMPVLRFVHRAVANHEQTLCKRATTPTEWRALREELGEFEDLPDDWCDFTNDSVIVIATKAARVWPGITLSVSDEGGVDVLTATQQAPSGVDPGLHSDALLAVVPKRKRQLKAVLRLKCGPAPATQKTLRVFPGERR